nr:NADH dehydrogenase subunit 3 [Chloeia sp. r EEE-2022]
MNTSLILYLIALLIAILVFSISWLLNQRSTMDREKASPFECGFDPLGSARIPFSLRFFLLAVIFLVFDIEIVLLMPLPLAFGTGFTLFSSLASLFFLIILILGLLHEWREGSLEWSN